MKKIRLILMVIGCLPMVIYAQSLKVRSDGNIVALTPDLNEDSDAISDKIVVKASNRNKGLTVIRKGSAYSGISVFGIYGRSDIVSDKYNYGVFGGAHNYPESAINSGRSYGVFGNAGNTSSGYNYGVAGQIYGTQNGAAIYGGFSFPGYISGRYAGYFDGNVRVTGTINGTTVSSSDIRYKQNILELKKKESSTLDKILSLNPVEYNLKQMYIEEPSDTTKAKVALYEEKSQVFQKKHYGLIAQDLQKIYPDLVYEEDNGYLSINYTGLIPLLIESIKELKTEIETLKGVKSYNSPQREATSFSGIQSEEYATLYQNIPNPFNQETEIAYRIPQGKSVFIGIYNLNGQQLKKYPLTNTTDGSILISASEFTAGIYIYSLVVDGQEVDSKRMVLTD